MHQRRQHRSLSVHDPRRPGLCMMWSAPPLSADSCSRPLDDRHPASPCDCNVTAPQVKHSGSSYISTSLQSVSNTVRQELAGSSRFRVSRLQCSATPVMHRMCEFDYMPTASLNWPADASQLRCTEWASGSRAIPCQDAGSIATVGEGDCRLTDWVGVPSRVFAACRRADRTGGCAT